MNFSILPRFVALMAITTPMAFAQNAAPQSVRTIKPKVVTTSSAYVIPGRTEPYESARIFTRATGIVQERKFDIGDLVKAGDVLAVIAVPDLDRAVEASKANVEQAEVRAANAQTLADRATNLLSARAVSKEETDQRVADAAAGQASVRVAKADLARLVEQQQFATVRAPFDAVVAARNFDRGDRVRGDSATSEGWLYQLVRLDKLRFTVFAAPDLALRLQKETKAAVLFGEFPGRTFTATVERSSRVFDPTSGTMRVELILSNDDLTLPAGLTGNAKFDVPPSNGTFLVPNNTLVTQAGQTQVATVADGKVAIARVSVGRNLGTQIEVTSAELTANSEVIVNPNGMLRPGEAVAIAQPPPAAPRP